MVDTRTTVKESPSCISVGDEKSEEKNTNNAITIIFFFFETEKDDMVILTSVCLPVHIYSYSGWSHTYLCMYSYYIYYNT